MATEKKAKATRATTVRMRSRYLEEIVPNLTKTFDYKNPMQVPKLTKVVLNMGMGAAVQNAKIIDSAVDDLFAITGQKPVIRRAKKAIANFKLREGQPIGVSVTLRNDRMYEFVDRLINIALPRVRDFRGVQRNSFDGMGNYTFGITEQIIFPEVDIEKTSVKGLNVTFVTSANTNKEAEALLTEFGFPFRRRPASATQTAQ
jgi:large subunit ribosomal protein L5